MKKLLFSLVVALGLIGFASDSKANGIIVSNLVAGTNVIYTGNIRVFDVALVAGTLDEFITISDSASSSNSYTQAAYVRSTNITVSITNLTTNGVFEYPGIGTNYLVQTNIYVSGTARSNVTVNAAVVAFPTQVSLFGKASTIVDSGTVDLTFTRGITVVNTNSCTVLIYYRN